MEIEGIVSGYQNTALIKKTTKEKSSFNSALQENSLAEQAGSYINEHLSVDALDPLLFQDIGIQRYSNSGLPIEDAMEDLMYSLDLYTKELGNIEKKNNTLVTLHEQLATLERNVDTFKKEYATQFEETPIADILNSLEVLMLTQRYRINKGDYLE